ncbi:MAG: pentapeptide repeat-containing protein [Thermomicrobiales bacterium]
MDPKQFDILSRQIAHASSRRKVLGGVLALPLAAIFGNGINAEAKTGRSKHPRQSRKRQESRPSCDAACRKCDPSQIGPSADLRGCDLQGMNLFGQNLSGSDLRGACLSGANLGEAILDGASLRDACLSNAALVDASLAGADLRGTNIDGVDLLNADLSGARVSPDQLDLALLCETRLPDGSKSDCGTCDKTCPSGETCCRGGCTDVQTDVKNCTRCGNFCPAAPDHAFVRCDLAVDRYGNVARGCAYFCEIGWDDCDGEFKNGCETHVAANVESCGACGHRCAEGEVCCGCTCVLPEEPCGECPTIRSGKLIRPR